MRKQIKEGSINSISVNLLEEQIKLILQSLELYAYNARYVLDNSKVKSVDTLVLTYEQLSSILVKNNSKSPLIKGDNIHYLKIKSEEGKAVI